MRSRSQAPQAWRGMRTSRVPRQSLAPARIPVLRTAAATMPLMTEHGLIAATAKRSVPVPNPAARFVLVGRDADPGTGNHHRFDLSEVDPDATTWHGLEEYLGAVAPGYYDVDWAHSRGGGLDAEQAEQMAALLSESIDSGHAASFVHRWMRPRTKFVDRWIRPRTRPSNGHPPSLRVEWIEAFRDFLVVCGGFALHAPTPKPATPPDAGAHASLGQHRTAEAASGEQP